MYCLFSLQIFYESLSCENIELFCLKDAKQHRITTLILYKYLPCNEYTFKALATKGLWCHHPKEMNDPLECLADLDRVVNSHEIEHFKALASVSKTKEMRRLSTASHSKINEILMQSRRKNIELYAFCSLSTKCDDVLMWAHYANSHKGIVIGVELDADYLGVHLQEVKYVDELPEWDILNYLKYMEGDDSHLEMFIRDLSVKSIHWKKESEYRIWRNGPGYFRFKAEQVKEIYFGVNCDLETKAVVLELLNFLPDDFLMNDMEINKKTLGLVW